MSLSITYGLTGTGWAECKISDDQNACAITASYLSDALFNLILAANAVIRRFPCVIFSFDEEPGEYRWVIFSPRLNEIDISILSFDELWGDKPNADGKLLFRTVCLPEAFANAVHAAAGTLLATHGEAGYFQKWSEHPFPKNQFEDLSRQLSAQQSDA